MIRLYYNSDRIIYSRFKFSGGELQVRLPDVSPADDCQVVIRADIRDSDDIMEMLLVSDAVHRINPGVPVHLVCPYFPYARQDRVCYKGEAFSAQVMCNLINSQGYASVEVWDPHSYVIIRDGIHRVVSAGVDTIFARWGEYNDFFNIDNPTVISPDNGALLRASLAGYYLQSSVVPARKIRDPNNGSIISIDVSMPDYLRDTDCLMVDDICDGGRTFIELAKVLRTKTTKRISLYVTHGIFSQGFDVFRGLIDHIYVANSFVDDTPDDLVTKMPDEVSMFLTV